MEWKDYQCSDMVLEGREVVSVGWSISEPIFVLIALVGFGRIIGCCSLVPDMVFQMPGQDLGIQILGCSSMQEAG